MGESDEFFSSRSFQQVREHISLFTNTVADYLPAEESCRILDIGCGSAGLLIHIAETFPLARCVGVDVSDGNIKLAASSIMEKNLEARISVFRSDYLAFRASPFDLIVSDSTLHNIAVADDKLFSKIAKDLKSDGLLIASMPNQCLHNSLLWGCRRAAKAIRCELLDALLFAIARYRYGETYSVQMIEQRVPYAYLLPTRYISSSFLRRLERSFGLATVALATLPHIVLAKPRHQIAVLRKM